MPIKAGIYTRFSDRPGADTCQSLEVQESRCREYAAEKGYEVVSVFREPQTSGGHKDLDPSPESWYTARPELYRAVQSLQKEMVLLVTKRDRIGRSVHGQGIVKLDVARHGCRIEAADEPNGETPENNLMQTMLAGVAEYERMLIIARTRAAMQHHQKNGRRMSRADKIPYGFQLDPENDTLIIPEEYEQETISIAKQYAIDNPQATGYAICQYLDSIGRTRRGGKSWKNASRLALKITR
jgi:site-specific DNA recombinase